MRHLKTMVSSLLPLCLWLWASGGWAAPGEFDNHLQKLIVERSNGGALELRLAMENPLVKPPESFSLDNPPRIVIDLPGVGNALGSSRRELNQGSLRHAEIIQGDDRTRLIVNLNQPQAYRGRMDGSDFVLALSAGNGDGKAESGGVSSQPSLQAVDFHRGKNGEGRVEIDLSDVNINVDVHQQGKRLLVDFSHASLPPALRRKLEVIDFGTPVQTVDTFVQDGQVRMVIEPKGNWEYASYQTDTRLVIEVKPIVEDPTRLAKGNNNGYTGDKLSLNFQNITVREALNVIADFTGLNIVISDSVSGSLTLRLKDVPWDQALDIIMQSRGLDMRKYGNVVQVAPNKEIADRAKEDVAKKKVLDELEPTQTEAFPFSYANAKDAKTVIDSYLKNRLKTAPAAAKTTDDPLAATTPAAASDAGMIAVDERTNTLYITAPLSVLEKVRDLIKKLDVPVRQVMIEARVVEASDKFGRSLGARLGMNGFGPTPLATPGVAPVNGVFGAPNNMRGTLNGTNVNLPVNNAAGTFSLMLFNATASRFLNLEITAQETDGKSHVISSPRVVTADQSEAIIEQGTEIPYQAIATAGGVATTTVAFKKAVLSLKVKPQITPEENVIMNVTVNKDTVGTLAINGVPTVDTNKVQTQVLVENGGTVVIGGVHTQTDQTTTAKVPMLGDVPVLGALFRNKARTNNKTELLIFLSPKVLKNSLAR